MYTLLGEYNYGLHDRPLDEKDYQSHQGMLRQTKQHISEQAKSYINRIDTYKIDEELREIFVVDDFGINIMYDCSIQDMVVFEEQLLQVGTHFIQKNEQDFDFEKFEYAFGLSKPNSFSCFIKIDTLFDIFLNNYVIKIITHLNQYLQIMTLLIFYYLMHLVQNLTNIYSCLPIP